MDTLNWKQSLKQKKPKYYGTLRLRKDQGVPVRGPDIIAFNKSIAAIITVAVPSNRNINTKKKRERKKSGS